LSLTFLAPQYLWALLALPAVVLLHFIRARKRRQEVSALFLWRRAQELAQARRRFSPSWLLLLQLAFVTLAALGLSQPALSFSGPPDRVLVIDVSASMAARDSDGIRLEKAVTQAQALLERGGRIAVVRAGLDATVAQSLTRNLAEARSSLRALKAADQEADLARALELAASIAPEGEIHLFSDQPPPVGSKANYHPLAGDAANLGISTFDVGIQEAYVAVVSTSPRPQQVVLELSRDDSPVAQTTLLIPAAGQGNATFPLAEGSGYYRARLLVPEWDALSLDDVAYAGSRELRVVLDSTSTPLERALDAMPNLSWRVTPLAAQVGGADVRILTDVDPAALRRGNYLLFPPPSAGAFFQTVRDWAQGDPLMRFVDLRETVVGIDPDWRRPDGVAWEVLARTADLTPVLMRLETPSLRIVLASFHPSQTDMVFRPAFPMLVANILQSFRGEDSLPLGSPLPRGATRDGRVVARAEVPGIYSVGERSYGVSLLSATESRIPGPVEVASAGGAEVEATGGGRVRQQRGVALGLVMAALALLLAEWLLWSVRQGGKWWPTGQRGS